MMIVGFVAGMYGHRAKAFWRKRFILHESCNLVGYFQKWLTKVQFVMKTLLQQFAAYNLWANGLITDAIQALPPELQTKEVVSSFASLRATLLHMLDAQSIWWQRMKLQERIVRPSEGFQGSMNELAQAVLQQNR